MGSLCCKRSWHFWRRRRMMAQKNDAARIAILQLSAQLTQLSWHAYFVHRKYVYGFLPEAFAIRIVSLNSNIACAVGDIVIRDEENVVKWRTRAKCEMVLHAERPETLIIFTRRIHVNFVIVYHPFFRVSSLLVSFEPNGYTMPKLTDECRMYIGEIALGLIPVSDIGTTILFFLHCTLTSIPNSCGLCSAHKHAVECQLELAAVRNVFWAWPTHVPYV